MTIYKQCECWLSCLFYLSVMQEQYKLVYDAVIELFKRQIKALDAQENSAASQVKVTRINILPSCRLRHASSNLDSYCRGFLCRPEMNHLFALFIHNCIVTEASNLWRCLCGPKYLTCYFIYTTTLIHFYILCKEVY